MTGTAEGLARFDEAVDSLLHFRVDLVDAARQTVVADPEQPLARVLCAYLRLLGTEYEDAALGNREFSAWLAERDESRWTEREKEHVAAVRSWMGGDMSGAGAILRRVSSRCPRDVLALSVGHQIDFLMGEAVALRDRIADALPAWSAGDAHLSALLGMHAFGLEETRDYARSEEVGLAAVTVDPADVWAMHAVVHAHEMRGRFGDGLRFMNERVEDFDRGNFFRVHNWWHYCLYALEAGRKDLTLGVFDAVLHPPCAAPVAMELVDASALLWRLYLEGHDEVQRFTALADQWATKMEVAHYAFNDLHAVMASVGAGRLDEADALVASRIRDVDVSAEGNTNVRFTTEVGLPACQAVLAFGRGRYDDVIEALFPIRHRLHRFGGSHAQRDVLQRTLLEAALRARRVEVAGRLLTERLDQRPSSPYNWWRQAALEMLLGRDAERAAAVGEAERLIAGAQPSFSALRVLVAG